MVSEEQNSDVELASEVIPVPQVQPKAEALEVVNNGEANNISNRKPRQRKKVLYNALLKQMEFYFGDSNLSKDRFLADLIRQNPDVDLEVFLRFNKIRALTTDISKIVKALRNSTMLKVSDDGTKVHRTTPIVEKHNVDECTVYIQRLPSDADHEWLTTLFSEYGSVAYVSIPKFKSSNKIKGFAFVEFENIEAAQKCLKAFREKGCELPSQTNASEVLSITTFSEGEKQEENMESQDNDVDSANEQTKQKSKSKKRKQSLKSDDAQDSDQSDSARPKKKKCEESDVDPSGFHSDSNAEENKQNKKKKQKSLQEAQDSDAETKGKEKSRKRKRSQVEETSSKKDHDNSESETNDIQNEENVKNTNEEATTEKTKKKKRKRKHHANYGALEATDMGLQVMGKREWKRLRNKYLELQRSKMKQLKQHLRKAQWNQWGNRMETESTGITDNNKKNPASNLEYVPGVIVKVELKEACVDPKGFKAELRSNSHVKYIDVKEGSNEAFIRCDSSDSAKEISEKTSIERQFTILTGDEEKFYWDKITRDREDKIGNKVRVKQRGRDKLLKKAEKELGKHIKFDEV